MNPFDFVNSISYNKNNLLRDSENDKITENLYNSFVVNRSLSYFPDTILYANDMNFHTNIDNIMKYEYLLYSIKKSKRYSKWAKSETSEEDLAIMKYFQVNLRRAKEYKKMLNPEQIQVILANYKNL